jgi:hypothetical protein
MCSEFCPVWSLCLGIRNVIMNGMCFQVSSMSAHCCIILARSARLRVVVKAPDGIELCLGAVVALST